MRPEDFVVDVTTASTDLNDDRFWEERYTSGDKYYHVLTYEERRASEAEKKRQARWGPSCWASLQFGGSLQSPRVYELDRLCPPPAGSSSQSARSTTPTSATPA